MHRCVWAFSCMKNKGKESHVQNYAIGGYSYWYFGELLMLLQSSGACRRDETCHFFKQKQAFRTIFLVASSLEGSTKAVLVVP